VNMKDKELLLAEERLRMVLEGSQQGFWDWNIETGEVQRNDRWAQILNYDNIKEFDSTTDTWTNLIHPDDRDAAWKSINAHLEGRTDFHRKEYRMRTKNGEYRWIMDHAKIVQRDVEGKPLRMSGTHIDITDRKEIEEERDRLIASLQDALSEIKVLRGILPICAHCKKIRDVKGYWHRLENYLCRHADVDFSHGICPDCVRELYPSFYKAP
ncbi:MAG: PAS domain S-box protein, partial [Candidatus Electrothrix sp. ATG2]|nr:PAS domain S-box protein [Candidatus Electrothrix sp. ATG2]